MPSIFRKKSTIASNGGNGLSGISLNALNPNIFVPKSQNNGIQQNVEGKKTETKNMMKKTSQKTSHKTSQKKTKASTKKSKKSEKRSKKTKSPSENKKGKSRERKEKGEPKEIKTREKPQSNKTTEKVNQEEKRKKLKVTLKDVDGNLETLLLKLSKDMLHDLVRYNGMDKLVKNSFSKAKVVEFILKQADLKGQDIVVQKCPKKYLASFFTKVSGFEPKNPGNKTLLRKECLQLLQDKHDNSLEKALHVKTVDVDIIDHLCKPLGFKEKGEKLDKIIGLVDEARLLGIREMFEAGTIKFLRLVNSHVRLEDTGEKEHLVIRFLGQAYDFLLPQLPLPTYESIKPGVTKATLELLSEEELLRFSKENDVPEKSLKSSQIKAILQHLSMKRKRQDSQPKKKRKIA